MKRRRVRKRERRWFGRRAVRSSARRLFPRCAFRFHWWLTLSDGQPKGQPLLELLARCKCGLCCEFRATLKRDRETRELVQSADGAHLNTDGHVSFLVRHAWIRASTRDGWSAS